jgi:hypothetical protein
MHFSCKIGPKSRIKIDMELNAEFYIKFLFIPGERDLMRTRHEAEVVQKH